MKTLKQILNEVDTRSKLQKLKDMRDHPTTEPTMKAAAQRAMDKIGKKQSDDDRFDDFLSGHFTEPEPDWTDDNWGKPKGKKTAEYPGSDKAYGFYRYNRKQRTYHGPFEGEKDTKTTTFDQFDRTVLHSAATKKWRERSEKRKYGDEHEFDTEATFPQKKHRQYPDD